MTLATVRSVLVDPLLDCAVHSIRFCSVVFIFSLITISQIPNLK